MKLLKSPAVHQKSYQQLVEALTGSPARRGNKIKILTNGDQIFPAMLSAIKSARHTINFVTFVYWRGQVAIDFANALADQARAGVEVNVLLDGIGASKMDRRLINYMQSSGVNVAWFRPLRWYNLSKLNNRTHRKILVVDSQIGFTGGVGIAEEWTGNAQDPHHWRDTHFQIEGPSVLDLLGSFMDNWVEATGHILSEQHFPSIKGFQGGIEVHVTSSQAAKGNTVAEKLFHAAIYSAQKNLYITTAYFAPAQSFLDALHDARRRGVAVKILTNGPHSNHKVARRAGHQQYDQLLAAGVKLYEYQPTLLHSKIMTIDGQWASVGSINFDDRSFVLNDEINLSFVDQNLVRQLDDKFDADLKVSKPVTKSTWRQRPLVSRLFELASTLVRRQL